ncbi:MAG: lysylphosphatidylglycerol synthase domain-containing protein, partial [Oleibacter sp.]|nr:lysylphosphatidylglycerol synthase domain-containing protein [Thalassolituus sp.]
ALVWVVQVSYGWSTVLASWQKMNTSQLFISLALMLISYLLRAMRFYDFFISQTRGHFMRLLHITVVHNFLNNLLPMRSGEAAFPVLMKTHFGLPYTHSAPALLWLRLLDLYVLLALAFISLQSLMPWSQTVRIVMAIALLSAPMLMLVLQEQIRTWLGNASSGWRFKILDLMAALPSRPGAFIRAVLWTILNWAMKLAVFAWLLQTFTQLAFFKSWTGATTGELSSVLPIHGVAGAGTYEAGVLIGLLPWGLERGVALAAAVNLHLFVLGTTFLLSGLLVLITKLAGRRQSKSVVK